MVWPYFVWSWDISYGLMVLGKILWFPVKLAELNYFRIVIMTRGCFYCLIYYFYLICPMKLTWWVWGLFKWRLRNICIYYHIVTLWLGIAIDARIADCNVIYSACCMASCYYVIFISQARDNGCLSWHAIKSLKNQHRHIFIILMWLYWKHLNKVINGLKCVINMIVTVIYHKINEFYAMKLSCQLVFLKLVLKCSIWWMFPME